MPTQRHLTRRDLLPLLPTWLAAAALDSRAGIASPAGPVLLSLTGVVRQPNRGAAADFDMAMLEQLPQHRMATSTPWFRGVAEFTGPLLIDLLAAAGAQGEKLRMSALNDYQVEIPVDDARRWEVVVARLLDGKPMPVRAKGPLFVIYPFDRHPELRTAVYYSRCIWQLRRIDVS